MVFKKPYAFLIKHFRLLNLILGILSSYILYKTISIRLFFVEYIKNNYSGNYYSRFYEQYISLYTFTSIILVLIGLLAIFILFMYKKKPTKFYLFSIIYYALLIIFFIYAKGIMITLETTPIDAELSRVYRDLTTIIFLPQLYLMVMYYIRGLGFNLKKFDFERDLKELEIDSKDNEEIEIVFKNNFFKYARQIRKTFREFTYYLKENKFVLSIVIIVIIGVITFIIYMAFPEVFDKRFVQGETFTNRGLNYRVEDSIVTNIDYKGDNIIKNGYYVVIKLYVENTTDDKIKLDFNAFRLEIDNKYLYPTKDLGINFIDYADNITKEDIEAKESFVYPLIFKIDNTEVRKNYKLKIDYNIHKNNEGLFIGSYNYVTIAPIVISKSIEEKEVGIDEKLSFSSSNLKNSYLLLKNIQIVDNYMYEYENCVNKECHTYNGIVSIDYTQNNKTLIVADFEYELDKNIPYYNYDKAVSSFITSFVKVKYTMDGTIKTAYVRNMIPINLKDKFIIETTSEIKKSNNVYVVVTIRNKEYRIKIK